MKKNNNTLVWVLLGIIAALVYYVFNKKRLDKNIQDLAISQAISAAKSTYKSDLQKLKNVYNGNKKTFE